MKAWRESWLLWLGLALILVTNAVALTGVAFNRSGSPQAVLTLSERELKLPWAGWQEKDEDSSLALTLSWAVDGSFSGDVDHPYSRYDRTASWLDAKRLRELGFSLAPPGEEWSWNRHSRMQPREMFLLLELEGDSHRRFLAATDAWAAEERERAEADPDEKAGARRLEHIENSVRDAHKRATRLNVIDAGLEAEALRAAYPDIAKFAVLRGSVRPEWRGSTSEGTYVGRIVSLDVESLHVPTGLLPVFDGLNRNNGKSEPAYLVDVAWGKRAEPWIQTARQR